MMLFSWSSSIIPIASWNFSFQYDADSYCLLGDSIEAGPGVPVGSYVGDNASGFIHSSALLNMACCINSTLTISLVIPTHLAALINQSFDAHLSIFLQVST